MIRALVALLLLMANTTPSGQPTPKQPGDFTPARQSKVVSWQLQRVLPPSPVYVGIADLLVVGAASSQTNEVVTVNYRLLRASDGVIVPGQFTVAPANTRVIKVQTQQLAEGFLLSVSVKAAVATTRGQTFVRAFLGSGPFGAGQPSYMLMADYVTTAMAPAHPNGRVLAPTEGVGTPVVYTQTPATGAEINFLVPANARWRPISLLAVFTASATVATRTPRLGYSTNVVGGAYLTTSAGTVAASGAVDFNMGAGISTANDPGVISVSIPPNTYISGNLSNGAIYTQTSSIQAGDKWTAVVLLVEEWLDNV